MKTHTLEGLVCVFCLCGKGMSLHSLMTFRNEFTSFLYQCTSCDRFSFVLLALRAHPASADPLPFSLVMCAPSLPHDPRLLALGSDRTLHMAPILSPIRARVRRISASS